MINSEEQNDPLEQLFVETNLIGGAGGTGSDVGSLCCPASPTTVPARTPQTLESPAPRGISIRSTRRQRTTSVNNQTTTSNPSECVIRSNNRTIYTAGRPPWYNCAGQQVEPFVIGKRKFYKLYRFYLRKQAGSKKESLKLKNKNRLSSNLLKTLLKFKYFRC